MKGTNIYGAESVRKSEVLVFIDNKWVLARPLGDTGLVWRLKCAWLVFTGRADALRWYKQ